MYVSMVDKSTCLGISLLNRYYKSTDFEVLGTVIKSMNISLGNFSLAMRLKNKQMTTKNEF